MSRITVYQKLFCYNTIAFKKIDKKNLHAKNTHLLYKIMQIHTKSKILLFFFNYKEDSNLKISFIIVTSFLSNQLNSLGD